MPDLTHRPTRYLTAAVVAAALVGTAVTQYGLRLGPDHRLAALEQQNAALRRALPEARTVQSPPRPRSSHPVAEAVSAPAPAPTRATPTPPHRTAPASAPTAKGADCAAYPDWEAAQAAFTAAPAARAAMDGDHDGTACEQLKHRVPTVVTRTVREPAPPAPPPAAPPAGPVLPATPGKAEILASGKHFGMSTGTTEEFQGLEASLQRQADMTGFFKGFDTGFDRDRVVAAWSAGTIPVMTWETRPLASTTDTTDYSLRKVADGTFDAYLTSYAQAVAALRMPLVIRFDQEMNGNWYRWAEFENPQVAKGDYVAAWRHVHDVFQAQGANDYAMWLWSPNRVDNLGRFPAITNYWPGEQYVDQVGMTGYLRAEDRAPFTFEGTYGKTLAALRKIAPGKPLLLSEVGATEDGGHKAAWLTSFFAGLANAPDVAGFVWFDYAVTSNGRTDDWRIDSTPRSYAAFSAGLTALGYGLDVGKRFTLRPRELGTSALRAAPAAAGGAA